MPPPTDAKPDPEEGDFGLRLKFSRETITRFKDFKTMFKAESNTAALEFAMACAYEHAVAPPYSQLQEFGAVLNAQRAALVFLASANHRLAAAIFAQEGNAARTAYESSELLLKAAEQLPSIAQSHG